jgi:hypothetical protein
MRWACLFSVLLLSTDTADGTILRGQEMASVVGGADWNESALSSIERYDASSGQWSQVIFHSRVWYWGSST